MKTCLRIQGLLTRLAVEHPGSKIPLICCTSKKEIAGMKCADSTGNEAVNLPQRLELTPAPSSVKKRIEDQLHISTCSPPPQKELPCLLGTFNPENTYKVLHKLPRPEATMIAQLRSGHCPSKSYLHRFKVANNPNCD